MIDVSEGQQGSTRFFSGSMTWGEILQLKVMPEELAEELSAQDEDEEERTMQRSLAEKRLPALIEYLNEVKDHFFSAVTLVITPRDLSQPANEANAPEQDADFYFERSTGAKLGRARRGTLYLSGNARLFPADGQHRIAAAQAAVATNPALAKEEVPVVLLVYKNSDTVRQRFSDLNLNAKPVNRSIGFEFDTRTLTVQLAKQAAKDVELFQDRVNRTSNSLSKSSTSVIAINTLVEGTRALVSGFVRRAAIEAGEKPTEPDERALDQAVGAGNKGQVLQGHVLEAWGYIVSAFDSYWDAVLEEQDRAAGMLRDKYVFPHGIGWQALAQAAAELIVAHGDDWPDVFATTVSAINWERHNSDFEGVAVIRDPIKGTNRVNNTGPGIKALRDYILKKASQTANSVA